MFFLVPSRKRLEICSYYIWRVADRFHLGEDVCDQTGSNQVWSSSAAGNTIASRWHGIFHVCVHHRIKAVAGCWSSYLYTSVILSIEVLGIISSNVRDRLHNGYEKHLIIAYRLARYTFQRRSFQKYTLPQNWQTSRNSSYLPCGRTSIKCSYQFHILLPSFSVLDSLTHINPQPHGDLSLTLYS